MAAAFLLLATEPAAQAATVLTISPVPGLLEKTVCQSNLCAPVAFTVMPELNVANLDYAIHSASAPIAVVAYSQAALAAEQWLRQHASDSDAPATDQLAFVLIGNPSRAYGGNPLLGAGVPPSQYQVIDIVREYDIVADAPRDTTNALAIANALAGFFFVHLDTGFDINDPANVVWTVGNTTYVMVPTKNLPLLDPLRALGMSELADALNGPLKAIIDQAYDRSVPAAALAVSPAPIPVGTPAASTSIASTAAPALKTAAAPVDVDPAGPAAATSETGRLLDTSSNVTAPDTAGGPGTPTADDAVSTAASVPDVATTSAGARGLNKVGVAGKSTDDPVASTGHQSSGTSGRKSVGSDAASAGTVGSKPGASTAESASGGAGSGSGSASSGAGSTGSGGSKTGGEGA